MNDQASISNPPTVNLPGLAPMPSPEVTGPTGDGNNAEVSTSTTTVTTSPGGTSSGSWPFTLMVVLPPTVPVPVTTPGFAVRSTATVPAVIWILASLKTMLLCTSPPTTTVAS